MKILELQDRLAKQYAHLRDLRGIEKYPVYAIEHGLSNEECKIALKLLNSELATSRRVARTYWLVWIAAAAEVGYRYDGREYWDTFSETFPSWDLYGKRNLIRDWYKCFASEYHGVKPIGTWAQQFPIIAWPITHSILPGYLQRHFADHLYNNSRALVRSGELTLEEIGDLLSEKYCGSSSRFENFLQQKTLTARIVISLQLDNVVDQVAPIELSTLQRIVSDVDKLGKFGERLRDARNVLREAQFINSHKIGFIPKRKIEDAGSLENRISHSKLVARKNGSSIWELSIGFPNLAVTLRQKGFTPQAIEKSRMRFRIVGGVNKAWMPGRALFSYKENSEEAISDLSCTKNAVLEFERPINDVVTAIEKQILWRDEPIKLLKLRSDGVGVEVTSKHVRASHSYILVAKSKIESNYILDLGLIQLSSTLDDVSLWMLIVSKSVTSKQMEILKKLGLGYVLGARVEPIGLCPRWNIESGALSILETESAIFLVSAEFSLNEFQITLNGSSSIRIKPDKNGCVVVVMNELNVGMHKLTVSALGTTKRSDIVAEDIFIDVRTKSQWQGAIAGKAGMSFGIEPRGATLVELLEGTANIMVRAPTNRNVRFDASFFGPNGDMFEKVTLRSCTTPISEKKLSEIVQQLNSEAQVHHFECSSRIDLHIGLEEYGSEKITFEKLVDPIRWVRVDDRTIKLANDIADDEPINIKCCNLDAIDVGYSVDQERASKGIELKGKGALMLASYQGQRFSVVATTLQKIFSGFGSLGIPAAISSSDVSYYQLLCSLHEWSEVQKLMGPLAHRAKRSALSVIQRRLEGALCGEKWLNNTVRCRESKVNITDLYGQVYFSRGFASSLAAYEWSYTTNEVTCENEFIRLADVYGVSKDKELCRFSLKLAFKPVNIPLDENSIEASIKALLDNPAIVRGAYYAKLVSDIQPRAAQGSEAVL